MRPTNRRGVDRRAASVRCRADRSILPTPEMLEVRQMLTAGPLGINVGSTLDFVDVMKNANAWTQSGSTPLTLDSQGWPTSDANVLVMDERVNQSWNGPDPNAVSPDIGGTYHLSFQGQATISADWLSNYTVQNQVYSPHSNTTTADLVVQHNGLPLLYVDLSHTIDRASSTGAGVSNVVLIQPGYAANTTQVFTTNYLNALQPFGTIRYLNADVANNFGPTIGANGLLTSLEWSQRTLPSAASQTAPIGGTQGVAWEYMIALANSSNTDMWINIPGPASNDYVTQLASLIKNGDTVNGVSYAGLNPNLKVYIEYSNEVWGGIYSPYAYNQEATKEEVAAGSVLNNDGATNPTTLAGRRYLERTMQITNIFRSVIGSDPTDSVIRPILGWQENNWQFYQQTLPWFESTYGSPSNFFYGMGDANYVGSNSDYSSVNSVFAGLASTEATEYATTVDLTTLAHFYGLKTIAYEGGPAAGSIASSATAAVTLAVTRDPRMEQFVNQVYTTWYAAGGDLANFYDGPFGTTTAQYGAPLIELADEATPTNSPKFRGIEDLVSSPTVAITAGLPVSTTAATTLSLSSDSLGASFTNPNSGQSNYWLLNASSAGNYFLGVTLKINAGSPQQYQPGMVQVYLGDRQLIGTYSLVNGTINLGMLPLAAGLNTLSIHTVSGNNDPISGSKFAFQPTSLTLTPQVAYSNVGSTGYSETGAWSQGSGYDEAAAGNASSTASWSFNVTPGQYEVATDWPASSANTTAATYQTIEGNGVTGSPSLPLTVGDAGFEAIPLGWGSASYDPTGSSWAFTGNAGISSNGSYMTSGNPSAPVGSQVAFLQQKGTFTQSVSGWAGGNYQLSFSASQRGDYGTPTEDFQILIDGKVVGTFTPSGTSYQAYTTSSFAVSSGTHSITFKGLDSIGGDSTALIDSIVVVGVTTANATTAPLLGDAGFETIPVGAGMGSASYDPTGSSWAFTGYAGISGNGSYMTFGNPSAPVGSQVAFLQQKGTFTQSVSGWAGGNYQLSFSASQRGNYGTPTEDFQILIDGKVVGTFTPSGTSYQAYTTSSFAVSSGTHSITFKGLDSIGGDSTALIDSLAISSLSSSAAAAATSSVSDPSFESVPAGSGLVTYDPSGSAWTFVNNAGVTANGSYLTSGNPSAPQGVQVGFIQQCGLISQTITGLVSGSYQISFSAAQRANYGTSVEDFEVLIDGVVEGTFKPSSTAYQPYSTPLFTMPIGTHTLSFLGLDTAGGDNTVLIDGVSLTDLTPNSGGNTQVLGSSTVNQTQLPVGFLDAGMVWQDLGSYSVTGSVLTVQLTNSLLGKTDAKSIRLMRIS